MYIAGVVAMAKMLNANQVLHLLSLKGKILKKNFKTALFCISIGHDYGYFHSFCKNMQSWK